MAFSVGITQNYPTQFQPIFAPDNLKILAFEERFVGDNEYDGNAQKSMSIRRLLYLFFFINIIDF